MTTPHAPARAPLTDWAAVRVDEAAPSIPVDGDLIDTAIDLVPGTALDLGCGVGQNSVWLAGRGWQVHGVDLAGGDITQARRAAQAAAVGVTFEVADITSWRPQRLYDLVVITYALPARGAGRSRTLEMASEAVAPGGTILVSEFDVSLAKEGWMAEKYLVSLDEVERHLDGFRINRSSVRITRHRHGDDERVLPVATVVATRRSDLRRI